LQFLLNCLPQILEDVEAVGDLHGIGCAGRCASGIGARAVTTNNGHRGMLVQPGFYGFGAAIGEEREHLMALQIDHNAAIGLTFATRPIIDADDGGRALRRRRNASYQTKQGVAAARHALARRLTGAGSAAKRKADLGELGGLTKSPPSIGQS
jgi:hypothetical protein